MLEKEFEYYLAHKEELIAKYTNKYIVIISNDVVGVYDTEAKAYADSISKYELGTFLIRFCDAKGESHKQVFHSRVTFAK